MPACIAIIFLRHAACEAAVHASHGPALRQQVKQALAPERARSAELLRSQAFLEGRLQEIEASRASLDASLSRELQQVIPPQLQSTGLTTMSRLLVQTPPAILVLSTPPAVSHSACCVRNNLRNHE